MASELTTTEDAEFKKQEAVIAAKVDAFLDVGQALAVIRDQRLYRRDYSSFEYYCRERWGMGKSNAYDLIKSAEVIAELGGKVSNALDKRGDAGPKTPIPKDRAVAREVAKAPPEKRAETWQKAVDTAPKDEAGEPAVTAKHVSKLVAEFAKQKADPVGEPAAAPVDEEGVAIPPRLIETFAARELFDEALAAAKALKGIINKLVPDVDGGAGDFPRLAGNEEVRRQELLQHYKNLYSVIKFARPYAVCPYCKGKGCAKQHGCHGLGWLTANSYKNVPGDMKAAMGKGAAA